MTDHVHFRSEPFGEHVYRTLDGRATWTVGELAPTETTILVDGGSVAQIPRIPLLRAVIVPWAGVGSDLLTAAKSRGCPVYNLHHNFAATVEMAVALLLAAARGLQRLDPAMRKGEWRRVEAVQLHGRTATIYGYGAIGRHVGRVCRVLGMNVIGVRRHPAAEDEVADGDLSAALAESNVLVVTAPLTPETEGRIGANELRLLRGPRVVVNVGRGAIIREEALYEALRDGTLHSAGIDVWYRYPDRDSPTMPSNFPIHELPNVVMSPHCGGGADQAEPLRAEALATLLAAILDGKPPAPVSPTAGY